MSDSTKIPGFRYVGTTSNPAFVTQDGRVRVTRVTLRTWVVQPGGVGGFEVAGREAAVREALRIAAELAAEDARVLARGKELLPRRRAYQLKRTSPDPGSAGMYSYGPASIWISGPISGTWYATVRFRSQEKDLDARSLQGVLDESMRWVDEAPKPSAKQLQQEIDEVLDR